MSGSRDTFQNVNYFNTTWVKVLKCLIVTVLKYWKYLARVECRLVGVTLFYFSKTCTSQKKQLTYQDTQHTGASEASLNSAFTLKGWQQGRKGLEFTVAWCSPQSQRREIFPFNFNKSSFTKFLFCILALLGLKIRPAVLKVCSQAAGAGRTALSINICVCTNVFYAKFEESHSKISETAHFKDGFGLFLKRAGALNNEVNR